MTFAKLRFGLLALALALAACQPGDLGKEIPVFVRLDTFTLRTDPFVQGSASANITEAWLNVDGDFLGAYSLPNRVPILGGGRRVLTLRAGIRDNGISSSPALYPFYQTFERTLDLAAGGEPRLQPEIRYLDDTRFAFIESFESGRPIFGELLAGQPENNIRPSSDQPFEGAFSGRIRLSRASPLVRIATFDRYRDLGQDVYLEMNFRSDVPVLFGLIGYDDALPNQPIPILDPGFLPSAEWKKIYFNFTPLILQAGADAYQVVLQAAIPQEDGTPTLEEASVWLDNIKLVHF